jgi:hypothetical protein
MIEVIIGDVHDDSCADRFSIAISRLSFCEHMFFPVSENTSASALL